ncbi:hypothetical protein O181_031442 [Austropuccinia psidii MF-1]|uniref:Uncharacterized protein n=1 Tax=Austropuccinia psidii MF-1 TaxID=1389203 RepID=A0A9Q3H5C9_9BASI|nr:hypothetical protein [Austropuccinia psidii MF-1]
MKIASGLPDPSGHLIGTDYLNIINWLSVKSNFESCFGTSGLTSIGRPPSSKQNGFQLMAIEVNKQSQNRLNLSSSSIRHQWQTYKKKYMAEKKFENLTGAGIMEEDESKGIKSMSEKLEFMCPCYAEMDVLFGHKPNVTPIASYDSQEKYSFNGDDDVDVSLDKENNGLESPLNLDPLLHNEDDLAQVENLQDESVTCETSENACLEWDRERWNDEEASNMEKQWFEEVQLQKQMKFEEKQHMKKYEFEKEKWNCELELKEKQCPMDLTIAAFSSRRPIGELEHILKLMKKK